MIPPYAPLTSAAESGPVEIFEGTITFETGDEFNAPVVLPSTLRHIKFGPKFNQPVTLNEGLQTATFGEAFDHPVDPPSSVTQLNMHATYRHDIADMKSEDATASEHLGPGKSAPVSMYGDDIQQKVAPRDVRAIGADVMKVEQTDNLVKEQMAARN